MKIGILLADELRELLQPQFCTYADMFRRLLADDELSFEVYTVCGGEFPQEAGECDGYLVTGSKHGVYDDLPWIAPLLEFIRQLHERKIPLIGVCFGHQAVAKALGGVVEKSDKGWGIGVHEWQIEKQLPWMTYAKGEGLRLLCVHQDQVLSLPPQAQRIAGSEFCENAAFSIGEHIFCVQGHPEFTLEYFYALVPYLREVAPAEVIDKAVAGAETAIDNHHCAKWMVDFYKYTRL